jgi:regulator of protease activity HflC (stomatin/prohibitin superfamily)
VSSGFAWLNELMVWIGRLFPRLVLVKAAHLGVWFGPKGRTRVCEPGLHVYWPLTSALTIVSTRVRTIECASMLNGREAISVAATYRVVDPQRMLLTQNDVFAMLDNRAQACLTASYKAQRSNAEIERDVLRAMACEFQSCGVDVSAISIVQRGRVIPLKNLNDWAQHAKAELA